MWDVGCLGTLTGAGSGTDAVGADVPGHQAPRGRVRVGVGGGG